MNYDCLIINDEAEVASGTVDDLFAIFGCLRLPDSVKCQYALLARVFFLGTEP